MALYALGIEVEQQDLFWKISFRKIIKSNRN